MGVAPWSRTWFGGDRRGVRAVTPSQSQGPLWEPSNTAAGRIRTSVEAPACYTDRKTEPREEGKTPKVLGVTDLGLRQFTGFGPKINIPRHWALPGQEAAEVELD